MTENPPFNPDALAHATQGVQDFYTYWCKIRGDKKMPCRADFDPIDIPYHLPGILLVDVLATSETGERCFRYRVVGDLEIEARNQNPTGLWIEDGAYPNTKDRALETYKHIQGSAEPLFRVITNINARGVPTDEFVLFVPLSEDDVTVSQILVYSEQRPRLNKP
ncbi:MAG: PAS domain-containing protein [Alphaproteobacteria bacterium]|nr:PAS domain-containing protein [Alphaproteobacteria bacterium]